jgi:hypothetical protein
MKGDVVFCERKATRRAHRREEEADLVTLGRGAGARHLEGDADGAEKTCRGAPEKATSLLVDRDLALTPVETPGVWGVPCQHASQRCPP